MQACIGIIELTTFLIVCVRTTRVTLAPAFAFTQEAVVTKFEAGLRITIIVTCGFIYFSRLFEVLPYALQIITQEMANYNILDDCVKQNVYVQFE